MRSKLDDDDTGWWHGPLAVVGIFIFLLIAGYMIDSHPNLSMKNCLHYWPIAECQARREAGLL